jgi:aminoglycoside/choline kinase family phosphotransferase
MAMESFSDLGMQTPFLAVQKHLALHQVDVPAVLDVDPARGMILLEDLGDVTLLRKLQDVSDVDTERHFYQRSIDTLLQLHHACSPSSKEDSSLPAFQLRFDVEKLMWEVNFTIEHFYLKFLDRKILPKHYEVLQAGFQKMCERLAHEPTVFTHRDFHSRNLMVTQSGRFVMIDFQDARMGPAQYDLASLLRDSYYQLDDYQVRRLIDYYIVRTEAMTRRTLDRVDFMEVFDWMAVQRNFKAIGSFASFLNRRGNPGYLKYIGNTFENIRRTLLKYPEFGELREILFHYYYF